MLWTTSHRQMRKHLAFFVLFVLFFGNLSGFILFSNASASVVFADGFESGSFSAWTGVNYGSPTVVTTDFNSGIYSMKAPATTDSLVYKTLGSSSNSLYVRAYVKYSSLSLNGKVESVAVGTSSGVLDAQCGVYIDGLGNTYWNIRDFAGKYTYVQDSIVVGSFYCMELYVQRSSGTVSLWINGVLKINVTGADLGGSDFNTVCVGSSDFASIGGYVSVDDVVVANSYIGPISGVGSPVVSNVSAGPVFAGGSCVFSSFWSDNVSLGGFVFSTNNTGVWVNDTWVAFSGTPSWGNVSKVLSLTVGSVVGYRWFVNDSSGVWVDSGVKSLVVQAASVVFADGFESGNFSAWTGINYGSPTVVTTDVNSGVYSMKAPATADSLVYKILDSSSNSLYVRAYVKYSSLSFNGKVESVAVGTSSGVLDAQCGVYIDGLGNTYWNIRDFAGKYTYVQDSIVVGSFYCMELYVQRSSGTVSLWINGVLKINVTGANLGGSDFNTVCVGSSDFASIGGYVSVDDVVVANSYIGPISGVGSPVVSNVSAGPVFAGGSCVFSSFWSDNVSLGGFVFSTNNTGVWVNGTWVAFSGTPSWGNVSKVLSLTVGSVVGYRWFVNDSSGVWVGSGIQNLTVQSVPVVVGSPVVSNVSAGPVFAGGSCVFSSFWSDNVSLGGFVFSTNNTGVWVNDTWVGVFVVRLLGLMFLRF